VVSGAYPAPTTRVVAGHPVAGLRTELAAADARSARGRGARMRRRLGTGLRGAGRSLSLRLGGSRLPASLRPLSCSALSCLLGGEGLRGRLLLGRRLLLRGCSCRIHGWRRRWCRRCGRGRGGGCAAARGSRQGRWFRAGPAAGEGDGCNGSQGDSACAEGHAWRVSVGPARRQPFGLISPTLPRRSRADPRAARACGSGASPETSTCAGFPRAGARAVHPGRTPSPLALDASLGRLGGNRRGLLLVDIGQQARYASPRPGGDRWGRRQRRRQPFLDAHAHLVSPFAGSGRVSNHRFRSSSTHLSTYLV